MTERLDRIESNLEVLGGGVSMTDILAITLWQPWATLITLGYKKIETRGWRTSYSGPLLIHGAKRPMRKSEVTLLLADFADFGLEQEFKEVLEQVTYGCIVAKTQLTDCERMYSSQAPTKLEKAVGFWQKDRFAWMLSNIQKTNPIPCKGSQGLWRPDSDIVQLLSHG